jgi:hydroxymethylpyrimidine pyrophosphatase-like HAD family hydrolase
METLSKETSRLFLFTDLDDTLFNSVSGEITDHFMPATVDSNGKIYAYSSIQQQKFLDVMVKSNAIIIPVTGRRSSSFLNCKLDIVVNSQYSVVSHGAIILNHKHELLDEWLVFIEQKFNLKRWQNALTILYEKLSNHSQVLDNGVRVRLIVDKGITVYICLKINKEHYHQDKSANVRHFLSSILPSDMLLHANGRNFAILPPYAQKKMAVDFLKQTIGVGILDTVFGMGDSHSDLPFMSDSDFLIVPNRAQIFEKE